METLEEPIFPRFEDQLMCSAPESHVSRQVVPGSEEAARITVGSGRQSAQLLDTSSQIGAFSKILLASSAWTSSEEFCYVWNRLDTKFGLSAFQLTPLGQSTGDSGFSLWRTPDAHGARTGQDGEARLEAGHALTLNDQVKTAKLWPTPVVNDARNGRNATANRSKSGFHHAGTTLSDAVYDPASGSLNPRFVEELMGFPIDHTVLKLLEMHVSRSRPTRSSRRSRRRSLSKPNPWISI